MRSERPTLLVVLGTLTCLCAAPSLSAQAPGYQQLDPRAVRAEYTAEVLDRINDIYEDWARAWSQDRLEELIGLYWEDAVLITPGKAPLRGHAQIRAHLEESLPLHGQAEAFMLDFDASGGMAQVFGNYLIQIQSGEGAGTQRAGPIVTIYTQRSRRWRIRTQIFIAN